MSQNIGQATRAEVLYTYIFIEKKTHTIISSHCDNQEAVLAQSHWPDSSLVHRHRAGDSASAGVFMFPYHYVLATVQRDYVRVRKYELNGVRISPFLVRVISLKKILLHFKDKQVTTLGKFACTD